MGGGGIDTAAFSYSYSSYVISISGSDLLVSNASEGTDRIYSDVEYLAFGDGTTRSVAQIRQDLSPPNISIGNSSVQEGNRLAFTVTLDRPATQAIILHYATIVGTASSAAGDYTGTTDSTITIAAGSTSGTIYVQTTEDTNVEPNETMQVRLLSTSYGNIADNTGDGTILNDDVATTLPTVSISGAPVVNEGGTLTFTVTRTGGSTTQPLTIYYAPSGQATSGSDYTAPSGNVTIAAGSSSALISIVTRADGVNETIDNETLTLTLNSASSGVNWGTRTATGTIRDIDGTSTALKTAAQLFSLNTGKLGTMADFALAAYGSLDGTIAYNRLLSPDGTLGSGWDFLNAADLPGTNFVRGYYVNANAAAVVARSADALVLSFRGTDDLADRRQWVNKSAHYDLLRPLVNAVDSYLAAHPEITKVYVVGHSLGAAMADAFMIEHTGAKYQAFAIADPGYDIVYPYTPPDSRIFHFWNEEDAINLPAAVTANPGDKNKIFYNDTVFVSHSPLDSPYGITQHKALLYDAEMRFISTEFGTLDPTTILNVYQSIVVPASTTYSAGLSVSVGSGMYFNSGYGNDSLIGSASADLLVSGRNSDVLSGGLGADFMFGGSGNDTYVVDNAGDRIYERSGATEGTDTVRSSTLNLSLASYANVENITLLGSSNLSGTGSSVANTITGNTGNNTLNGLGGNDTINGAAGNDYLYGAAGLDTLTGGSGYDRFVFNTSLSAASNIDRIVDFYVPQDTILLENSIFTAVGIAGALSAAAFWKGLSAHDASDRIIYNPSTGALIYDSNGSAAGGATQFATLSANLALTYADFIVI